MRHSLLLGLLAAGLCHTAASAQQSAVAPRIPAGTPDETAIAASGFSGAAVASQPAPLTLRAGAVATGISGFYDYQSNGMLHGRIIVEPGSTTKIHTAYMLATDGTDSASVSATRRVGYAYSENGGQTWQAVNSIDQNFRLGFPYLALTSAGKPYLAVHGDPDGAGTRTLIYTGSAGSTSFTRTGVYERFSFTAREGDGGAGVIWPAMVIAPGTSDAKQVVAATLSPKTTPTREDDDPLHFALSNIGSQSPWDIITDDPTGYSSGGRNVLAVSPAGKIGLAYYHTQGNVGGTSGTYYTESTDGGKTWKAPVLAIPASIPLDDVDTIHAGGNLDMTFNGETPLLVVSGNINYLYARQGVFMWNPSSSTPTTVAMADSTIGLGLVNAVATKAQPNMDYISYPSVSVGDDGQHVVVTFQAAAQASSDAAERVVSEDGFAYFRVWAAGSPDGGATWHTPRILQDFAGEGTDSASIEYPIAAPTGKVTANSFEHMMTFHARSKPGMYAFIVADVSTDDGNQPADRGPFSETFQYFQKTTLDPTFFGQPAAVKGPDKAIGAISIAEGYPNPATEKFTVSYTLPTLGTATLRVYDALGAEVMTLDNEMGYAGRYTREINIAGLPSGQYRLVVSQSGAQATVPFTVVH